MKDTKISLIREVFEKYEEDVTLETWRAFEEIREIIYNYNKYVKEKCISKLK